MANNETQHIYSAEYEGGSSAVPASSVIYDNTTSGLDAVTAQAAIDEIEAQIDVLAAQDIESTGIGDTTNVQGALNYIMSVKVDKAFNNTTSDLQATTIVDAINELSGATFDRDSLIKINELGTFTSKMKTCMTDTNAYFDSLCANWPADWWGMIKTVSVNGIRMQPISQTFFNKNFNTDVIVSSCVPHNGDFTMYGMRATLTDGLHQTMIKDDGTIVASVNGDDTTDITIAVRYDVYRAQRT